MTRRTRSIQISDVIRAAVKLPSGLDITDQANTARNQANSAFDHANTAYSHAGNAFNHANNSHNQANSAYAQANAAYSAANTKLNSSGGTISGSLIVTGNLFVEGDSTSFNVASLLIEDSEIYLNNNQTTPSLNASIFAERGSSTDTFIRWNESTDKWGWSDDGSAFYSFDDLRSGLATTNTTFGTINTSLGTINTNIGTAYAQANAAYAQANTARSDANTTFATINTTFATLNTSAGTQNTTFGTINTNIGTAYSQANAAYGQANSAFAAANNRVLKAGDTMTGQLNISSGGLLVTGNVGFGSSPAFTTGSGLEIQRATATATLRLDSSSFATELYGYTDGTGLFQLSAGYLDLGTNNTTRLRITSNGNVGIGTASPGQKLDVTGSIRASSQLISTVATGTAPLAVSSTTVVTNLNADLVDGIQGSSFLRSDASATNSVDLRAPIFYDSNDTTYFVDPNAGAASSRFWTITPNVVYFAGVGANSTIANQGYAIYQEAGTWTHPYPDLAIAYHTGIKIGAYFGYNGTRFYNNNDMGTQIASVGDGDNNFRSYYNVIAYASDGRLKENLQPISDAINKVKKLTGMTFDWKPVVKDLGFEPNSIHEAGVIAQDVEAVLPEAVEIAPFDYDWKKPNKSKSGERYLTVKYEKLVPLLIQAIKEQQEQIEELKNLIEEKL